MPTIIQGLILVIGSLLSVLLTITINELRGMRSDLRTNANEVKDMNERLIILETEHKAGYCQYRTQVQP